MSQVAPRVGIVLVSHSARLAEGTADLAGQVSGGTVRVVAAGGTEDGELGTSAEKVARALASAEAGGSGAEHTEDLRRALHRLDHRALSGSVLTSPNDIQDRSCHR